jgi:hypothetical protein
MQILCNAAAKGQHQGEPSARPIGSLELLQGALTFVDTDTIIRSHNEQLIDQRMDRCNAVDHLRRDA